MSNSEKEQHKRETHRATESRQQSCIYKDAIIGPFRFSAPRNTVDASILCSLERLHKVNLARCLDNHYKLACPRICRHAKQSKRLLCTSTSVASGPAGPPGDTLCKRAGQLCGNGIRTREEEDNLESITHEQAKRTGKEMPFAGSRAAKPRILSSRKFSRRPPLK